MSLRIVTPPTVTNIPFAPGQYDQGYFNRMVQVLQQFMQNSNRATTNPTFINVTGMPLNGNLLPTGTVYIDYDTLKVVLALGLYAPSYPVTAYLADVSWTVA